jgi:hypothetical protein
MAWITPTEAHVLTRISSAELEAVRNAVLADGQADPVAETLEQTIDEVRGYIAGNPKNVLGPALSIPEKLLAATLSIFVPRFLSRPGGTAIDPEGERAKQRDAAIRLLERVSEDKFGIEEPTETTDEKPFVQTPRYISRKRDFTRNRQSGL